MARFIEGDKYVFNLLTLFGHVIFIFFLIGPFQRFTIDRYQDALMSRYKEYGPIVKETIAGVTTVRVFDPDDVRTVFMNEDKQPHVAPLLETTKQYREQRDLSPGLGNT